MSTDSPHQYRQKALRHRMYLNCKRFPRDMKNYFRGFSVEKCLGRPILKERASWHSIGTLFCLTIHVTNSLRPYRVTTGSTVLAAIPNHRESESTISVQRTTLIPGFYISVLEQMTEMYFLNSNTLIPPNKHFVHGTPNFHNLGEPTWSDLATFVG